MISGNCDVHFAGTLFSFSWSQLSLFIYSKFHAWCIGRLSLLKKMTTYSLNIPELPKLFIIILFPAIFLYEGASRIITDAQTCIIRPNEAGPLQMTSLLPISCCILAFDPVKNAIPRWCTGRKWHILMAVMRGNRVGGNWLMKWDELKNSHGTLIDWCTGREWPLNCMTVISAWWRSNMRFQRSSGRWTII